MQAEPLEPLDIDAGNLGVHARLERIESKLDELVSTLERFRPLLELAEQRAGRRGMRWGGARGSETESGER